jgi:hypothetical protein
MVISTEVFGERFLRPVRWQWVNRFFNFVFVVVEENDQRPLGFYTRGFGVGAGEWVRPMRIWVATVVRVKVHPFAGVAGNSVGGGKWFVILGVFKQPRSRKVKASVGHGL